MMTYETSAGVPYLRTLEENFRSLPGYDGFGKSDKGTDDTWYSIAGHFLRETHGEEIAYVLLEYTSK